MFLQSNADYQNVIQKHMEVSYTILCTGLSDSGLKEIIFNFVRTDRYINRILSLLTS